MLLIDKPVSAGNSLLHLITVLGTDMSGLWLYCSGFLVVADAIRRYLPFRHEVAFLSSIVLGAMLFTYGLIHQTRLHTVEVEIPVRKLSSPLTVVQLTDMHLGHFRGAEHVAEVVRLADVHDPDLVLITGDLFDGWHNFKASTIEALKDFDAPVFYIIGNHEIRVDAEMSKKLVASLGNIRVLDNETVSVCGIELVGLDYMAEDLKALSKIRRPHRTETIEQIMDTISLDHSHPVIVMHHSPKGAEYVAAAGADLFIAGHTHGGQFLPVSWLGDIRYRHNRGLGEEQGMPVYVSCGTGTTGPAMRVGTDSELTVLHLVPGGF